MTVLHCWRLCRRCLPACLVAEDDYSAIWDEYAYQGSSPSEWFRKDFGKLNATGGERHTVGSIWHRLQWYTAFLRLLSPLRPFFSLIPAVKGGARRAEYLPQAQEVWWQRDADGGLRVVVKATFDEFAVRHAGAPKAIWTEISSPAGSQDLLVDVTWQEKTPTRLPEAFWLRWTPRQQAGKFSTRGGMLCPSSIARCWVAVQVAARLLPHALPSAVCSCAVNTSSWLLYKLGQPVSPLEVLRNGSQSMHAVGDEGVSVASADGQRRLVIRSLDAPLVSPGRPMPFPSLTERPDLNFGVSHCLQNNIWGTNYIVSPPCLTELL